jgi:hypothetical protein
MLSLGPIDVLVILAIFAGAILGIRAFVKYLSSRR